MVTMPINKLTEFARDSAACLSRPPLMLRAAVAASFNTLAAFTAIEMFSERGRVAMAFCKAAAVVPIVSWEGAWQAAPVDMVPRREPTKASFWLAFPELEDAAKSTTAMIATEVAEQSPPSAMKSRVPINLFVLVVVVALVVSVLVVVDVVVFVVLVLVVVVVVVLLV